LSKRKLKWFVENGHVDGWDDPRFPTLRGILRRGVTIEAIKDFMLTIGPSKNTNLMSWDRIYAINKDHIDPVAKRLFAVSADSNVLVEIDNFNEDEEVVVDWHPKNKELGVRKQFRSNRLLIETEDSKDLEIDTKLTLYKWGNSRITKLEKDENGQLKKIHLRLTPEDQDFKKTKVAHWISNKEGHYIKVKGVEFDHIITKEKPEEEDKIEDIINPNSKIEYDLFVEPIIESIIEKTSIQFERRGYYYVDKAMSDKQTAVLHYIPDGKSKSMSVIGTKVDLKTLTGAKDDGKSKKQEKKKEKTEKVQTEEEKQKAKEAIEKKKKQKEEVENK
jgi:glutamyl-tRNA synthetase